MWIRRVGACVSALAYAPDSRTLYTVEGGRVSAWDLASRQPTRLFHSTYCDTTFATSDGRYLVCHMYSTRTVWDLHKQQPVRKLPRWGTAPVPAPHGPTVRFLAHDRKTIRAFDPTTRKTHTLAGPIDGLGRIWCWAFTADDKKLLLVDDRGTIVLVDRATGITTPVPPPAWKWGRPSAVHFSPDGNSLVLVQYNFLEIWDATTLSVRVPRFEWNPYGKLALHPRSPLFATGSGGNLTLFSLLTGEAQRTFQLGLGRAVVGIAFSPDGLTCAAGGTHKQFAVFDLDL